MAEAWRTRLIRGVLTTLRQYRWGWILTRGAYGLAIVFGILQVLNVPSQLMDFATFVAAGRAALTMTNPYARVPVVVLAPAPHQILGDPNLNAPASALLFVPFALVPLEAGLWIFRGLSVVAYAVVLWLVHRHAPDAVTPGRLLWAVAVGGVWSTLANGQLYIVLMAALVVGLLCATRGLLWLAGLLVGLVVAVKPNFLVLPILLFLAGHRKLSGACLALAALFAVLPVLEYGPAIYVQWVSALVHAENSAMNPINVSLIGAGIAGRIPIAGWTAALALLVGTALYGIRTRPDASATWKVAVATALLVAPETLALYSVFLVPFLLARSWTIPLRVAAGIFVIPPLLLIVGPALVRWLWPVPLTYTVAFVLFLLECLRQEESRGEVGSVMRTERIGWLSWAGRVSER